MTWRLEFFWKWIDEQGSVVELCFVRPAGEILEMCFVDVVSLMEGTWTGMCVAVCGDSVWGLLEVERVGKGSGFSKF